MLLDAFFAKKQSLIPVVVYEDIASAHDFLVRVLGFEDGGIERDGDGRAVHGEIRWGTNVIWLHRADADQHLDSPKRINTAGAGIVVYVPDVDAHHARAIAAGARPDHEPQDRPYGQREYGVRDPEDHRWWFATPIGTT